MKKNYFLFLIIILAVIILIVFSKNNPLQSPDGDEPNNKKAIIVDGL